MSLQGNVALWCLAPPRANSRTNFVWARVGKALLYVLLEYILIRESDVNTSVAFPLSFLRTPSCPLLFSDWCVFIVLPVNLINLTNSTNPNSLASPARPGARLPSYSPPSLADNHNRNRNRSRSRSRCSRSSRISSSIRRSLLVAVLMTTTLAMTTLAPLRQGQA